MNSIQKQKILKEYCDNEMVKLKQFCYPKICKIGGISQMDYDDLYSIALDVLRDSAERFDDSQNCKFATFLSNNLQNKFDTYVRDRNVEKRKCPGKMEYFDAFAEDGVDLTEKIRSDFCIEDNLSQEFGFSLGENIQQYLNSLSETQRFIAQKIMMGYQHSEIKEILKFSEKKYKRVLSGMNTLEQKNYD